MARPFIFAILVFFLGGCALFGTDSPKLGVDLASENAALKRELHAARSTGVQLAGIADSAEDEAAFHKAEAEKVKAEADLGKAAAKRSLASAARGVGLISGLIAVLSVFGLIGGAFFGGIGRSSCIMGLLIGAGGVWVRYFILAHGYFVSEAISWVLIGGVPLLGALFGLSALRAHLAARTARQIAGKRADAGEPARDAFMALPVGRRIKKALDDDWQAALAGSGVGALLQKYKLPVPNPTAVKP